MFINSYKQRVDSTGPRHSYCHGDRRRGFRGQIGFPRREAPDYSYSRPDAEVRPIPAISEEERACEKEIAAAAFVLQIQDEGDSEDFAPYEKATLDRAVAFLRRLMLHAHASGVLNVGVPQIGPASRGSIDVFWEKSDRTLLVNFPKDQPFAKYYGQKPENEIAGRFEAGASTPELAAWLAQS